MYMCIIQYVKVKVLKKLSFALSSTKIHLCYYYTTDVCRSNVCMLTKIEILLESIFTFRLMRRKRLYVIIKLFLNLVPIWWSNKLLIPLFYKYLRES